MTTFLSLGQWGFVVAVGVVFAAVGFRVGARAPKQQNALLMAHLSVVEARERGRTAGIIGPQGVVARVALPGRTVPRESRVDTRHIIPRRPGTTYRAMRLREWPVTLHDLEMPPAVVPDEDRPVEVADARRGPWLAALGARASDWFGLSLWRRWGQAARQALDELAGWLESVRADRTPTWRPGELLGGRHHSGAEATHDRPVEAKHCAVEDMEIAA